MFRLFHGLAPCLLLCALLFAVGCGQATQAAAELEQAVRLSPDRAQSHYQLAQAYRSLGRAERAQAQLAIYRELKDKQRARTP